MGWYGDRCVTKQRQPTVECRIWLTGIMDAHCIQFVQLSCDSNIFIIKCWGESAMRVGTTSTLHEVYVWFILHCQHHALGFASIFSWYHVMDVLT